MTDHAYGMPYHCYTAAVGQPYNEALARITYRDGNEPTQVFFLSTSVSHDQKPMPQETVDILRQAHPCFVPANEFVMNWVDTLLTAYGQRVYVYHFGPPRPPQEVAERRERNGL